MPKTPEETVRTVVIVPTYNEAENLERLVRELRRQAPEADVLVVDDRSPDGTGEIAERLASVDARVHVLHRDPPKGRGLAGRDGYWPRSRWARRRSLRDGRRLLPRPRPRPALSRGALPRRRRGARVAFRGGRVRPRPILGSAAHHASGERLHPDRARGPHRGLQLRLPGVHAEGARGDPPRDPEEPRTLDLQEVLFRAHRAGAGSSRSPRLRGPSGGAGCRCASSSTGA
jgi:hypothetical protein